MSLTSTLITLNGVLSVALIGAIIYKIFYLKRLMKKRTYALLITPDKNTEKVLRLNLSEKFFRYKGGVYNITKPFLKHGNTSFLIYVIGKADPVDVTNSESLLDADVYDTIISAEVIKALNKGSSGLLGNLNWKTILLIGAGLLIAIYFMRGGTI